ncbi:MAG: putative RNA dependent RNA polymerase [Lestijarvi alphachrysovirus]|nr:MAG: putative RNA dependent RNA polymerase [Lestijarvi alphachrysovirus]
MANINLGILKSQTSKKLKKKYSVVIQDSPHSFEANSFDCGFGFGRLGSTGFETLKERYENRRVEGLYAIVIPAGGGKSTLAMKFDQIDVDKILPAHTEDSLRRLRMETHHGVSHGASRAGWLRHNTLWARHLEMAICSYDFEKTPRVIFIHSHEMAVVIGAEVIGVLIPSKGLHEKWVSDRDPAAQTLSFCNREMLLKYSPDAPNMIVYTTELELSRHVAEIISNNLGYYPGVGSYLSMADIDKMLKESGFDATIPQRIKREEYEFNDLDTIISLCKAKRCPWWHVTTWCKLFSPGLLADGAYSLETYPWLQLGYEMQSTLRNRFLPGQVARAMIKSNLDWFGIFPYADLLTQSRGGISLRSVFKHLDASEVDDYLITILNSHVGSHHAFVVSLVCYYLGIIKTLRPELRNRILESGMLLIPEEKWVEIHTEIHKWVRASQSFFGLSINDKEYAWLQYTAGLYGRRNYRLDPQAEIEKRQKPRLVNKSIGFSEGHNNEEYIKDFKAGVRLAYVRLGTKGKTRWQNFEHFFQSRYQWAAGGSVTNVPDEMRNLKDISVVVAETKQQLVHLSMDSNKKRAMEKITGPAQLAKYLQDNWAYNITSLAPKPNEPAKNRVLMPGSFLHYVAMSYILGMVERTGDVGAVRVGDPEDNNLSHFDLRMMEGTYNFMLDFADHNAQHSGVEMALIVALLEEKFSNKSDPEDLHYFINWVIDSFSNMKVRIGPNTHDVISGLFTGWRGTTWINSVACQAYVHVGVEACRRKYGAIECEYFEGAGDDVLMKFGSAKDAFRFYECMIACGFDMQSIKQMASHRLTEFLRTISTGGHLACCINRVLPNFISGDLERSGEGMLDKLGGCYATIKMLVRRGLRSDIAKVLYESYLDKWARVKINDSYVDVDRKYVHAPTHQGGLGLPDSNDAIWYLAGKINIIREKKTIIKCPDNASNDYAKLVRDELLSKNLHLNERRYKDRLVADVYAIQDEIEPESLIDIPQRIIAAVPVSNAIDSDLLATVIDSVGDSRIKDYKRQWGMFSKYKQALNCLTETTDVALSALGVTIDISALERLRFPSNYCFLIPEYLLYNIGLYYRSKVAFREMSTDEAEYYFTIACSTAKSIFSEDLML